MREQSTRITTHSVEGRSHDRTARGPLALRRALVAAVLLLAGALGAVGADGARIAAAAGASHPTLVNDLPTTTTPHVTNGNVRSVAVAGNTVVLGGDFTGSTDPNGTVANRSYLLAFDRTTGQIRRDWAPQLDGEVYSVVAHPDGQSVYVGGRFNTVDGVTQLKVARFAISDGHMIPFRAEFDALVTTLAVAGDRLFVGGVFDRVQSVPNRRLAGLDLESGIIDPDVAVNVQGLHRTSGDGKIWRIEPSPDGAHLIVIGSFSSVGGQPRNQIVKLDTNAGGVVTVNPWSTTAFSGYCASFQDYVRDVSYSPDGTFFVVGTTGAKGTGLNGTCDSVTRWDDNATPNAAWDWIDYTGGDSVYSIEVTDSVVYAGGHFRYTNNSYGSNNLGPGGIGTEGIASLDPTNGLPLSWNPGRDRGRAVWQMLATPDGLYVASDTDRIARYLYRGRIAFFPLAGGRTVPQPGRLALPIALDQYVPAGGGQQARIASRDYDGTAFGAPATAVANASALSGARAAFLVNGILYTAQSNGTLQARSYDGSTLGAPVTVDLYGMSAFASDLANMSGAVYDDGRLFYTRTGSSTLYMRYFSTENRVVGAQRFDIASSGGGLSYQQVGNMVIAGNDVYYVDKAAGTLVRATWNPGGGIDPASRTTVAPANAGGISWPNTVLFARQGQAPNQPPTAALTVTCTGRTCSYDASASNDPDGSIATISWAFGDGQNGSGATTSHTYAADGPYTVTVTVTDDEGATGIASQGVNVAALAPTAVIDAACADATCTADGSGSSDPDGTIVAWDWTFGDGASASGASVSHTYGASGPYTITLTVTDDQGLTASTTKAVTVTVPAGRGFIGLDSATSQNTSRVDRVTVPAEVRAGDQLLIFAASNASGTDALDASAGWDRVLDGTTPKSRSAVFARTATAADAGTQVEVTTSIFARTDVVLVAYRGLALPTGDRMAVTGYTTPSRQADAGDWVLSFWADKSATTTGWTAPAGVTTRHSFAGSGPGHVSELLADTVATTSGATPPRTAVVAQPVSNAIATTLVLKAV